MAKRKARQEGYAKILDAWVPPPGAGDPVGCVATTFTFSAAFFEEECLSRFLQLETTPDDDGRLYLVDREEKLSQITCAAALVDQHHCKGIRSLRWNLLSARLPKGILHAKITILLWTKRARLIVASANLTRDGYRRNQEVFGVIDYHEKSDSPLACLHATIDFLHEAASYAETDRDDRDPAVESWNAFLEEVEAAAGKWGREAGAGRRKGVEVYPVLIGPGRPSFVDAARGIWPGGSPPNYAEIVSPFFDMDGDRNRPAEAMWELLRRRGEAQLMFDVTAEDVPGENRLLLHAPESLRFSKPAGREAVYVNFRRLTLDANRPLHAKSIRLESTSWIAYMMGSSNFTGNGLGLSPSPNLEANLIYTVAGKREPKLARDLERRWLPYEDIPEHPPPRFKPRTDIGEDEATGTSLLLPEGFGRATFRTEMEQDAFVDLTFKGPAPASWELLSEDEASVFYGEAAWKGDGEPSKTSRSWAGDKPPSGFWVTWEGAGGKAWWPVNVESPESLPPPEELVDLSLEALIDILTSARPLHQVMRKWLRQPGTKGDRPDTAIIDPHKRVDTHAFLIQRTRRISWALLALRERLSRPVPNRPSLDWRLRGPIGVMAVAKAIRREAASDAEKCFLLAELALELSRVSPKETAGGLSASEIRQGIRDVVRELHALTDPAGPGITPDLRSYIAKAFGEALK